MLEHWRAGRTSIGHVDQTMRSQIFRFAISDGKARGNPVYDVMTNEILEARKAVNCARIEATELPLLRKIEPYQGTATTWRAVKLIALTFFENWGTDRFPLV